GCKKFDSRLSTDPNNPATLSSVQLIANAEYFLPDISSSPNGVHYAQYLSLTAFTDNSRFVPTNFNFYTWYSGPLKNLEEAIAVAKNLSDGPLQNQRAVAKILKAYYMWYVTDRWGDLPYTDALKGAANYTPKYDKQQEIYNNLFALLDEANSEIILTNGNIKNDIIYNGDIAKWKKLGNTIHLLMALRLSKIDPTKGQAEFNKAITNGLMTANNDNLAYPHLAEQAHENYWYNSFTRLGRNWYALSNTLVNYMKPLNDPRLPVYGNPNSTGAYNGLEFGKASPTTADINASSLLGSSLRLQNSTVQLVTYAQQLFALAEGAKLNWIAGGDAQAQIHYNNAITESIRQWTGSTATAAAFLAQPNVAYDAANALSKIGHQRWVHLFLHGYEGWSEWRRTGFPVLTLPTGINGGVMPR
ncbi:MAG: SusD/RagB family nutrient-binding outer membrane lipoprotein, partial [Pedobacter sp.]